jgi:hypothetical protein
MGYLHGNINLWPKSTYLITYLKTFVEASYIEFKQRILYGKKGKGKAIPLQALTGP